MPVWKVEPIEKQPEISLGSWTIRELPNGDRHFVGYNDESCEGRVSTKIVRWDLALMTGQTNSGRVYKLIGESGYNGDAEYVWDMWRRINNAGDDWVEVTLEKDDAQAQTRH